MSTETNIKLDKHQVAELELQDGGNWDNHQVGQTSSWTNIKLDKY